MSNADIGIGFLYAFTIVLALFGGFLIIDNILRYRARQQNKA